MFHRESLIRHEIISVRPAADDDIFGAPTAAIWKELILRRSQTGASLHQHLHQNLPFHPIGHPLLAELSCNKSRFTASTILHGIFGQVCEAQVTVLSHSSPAKVTDCFDMLICWYFSFEDQLKQDLALGHNSSPHCLIGLRHSAFMNLFVDFNILERAVREEDADRNFVKSDDAYITRWVCSMNAKRCLMHAQALLNSLGSLRLNSEVPIHIPHCLFLAGIASYWCMSLGKQPTQLSNIPSKLENLETVFPEFACLGGLPPNELSRNRYLCAAQGITAMNAGKGSVISKNRQSYSTELSGARVFSAVVDILQRTGHWGISRRYARTLQLLAYADEEQGNLF
jgi:hypothetical protein